MILGLLLTAALAGEPAPAADSVVTGTPPVPAMPAEVLLPLARGAHRTELRGMGILGSWAVTNLAAGTVGWALADDPRIRSFHAGNALWNTVNLGLAAGPLLTRRRPPELPLDHAEVLRRSDTLDRALLFNAGLDVGYMAGGLAVREYGLRREDGRFQGFGEALLLQGAFLFAFDVGLYLSHRRWTRRLLGR